MTVVRKVALITICTVTLLGGISIWAVNSPLVEDYYLIYYTREKSEGAFVLAFTIALRRNHPAVYQMAVPDQHPRLDQWMKTHQPQFCKRKAYLMLGGGGTVEGNQVVYACTNANPDIYDYALTIDNIIIENNLITDWGPIKEEISK